MAERGLLVYHYPDVARAQYDDGQRIHNVRVLTLKAPLADPDRFDTAELSAAIALVQLEDGQVREVPFDKVTTPGWHPRLPMFLTIARYSEGMSGPINDCIRRSVGRPPDSQWGTGYGNPPTLDWRTAWRSSTRKEAEAIGARVRACEPDAIHVELQVEIPRLQDPV